jgi:hypothetical protein
MTIKPYELTNTCTLAETETAFVGLLEDHCNQEGAIKPLRDTFFERINRLKEKANAAVNQGEIS